jgi:hypothetical protein
MNACGLCERPMPADEPAHLCLPCTLVTRSRLEELPALYRALAAHLAPGARPAGGPVAKRDAPLPCAEAPLVMRGPGGTVAVLEEWVAALHADRGWTAPRPGGDYEQRLGRAVGSLLGSMPWIALSWSAAGDFAREVREQVAAARSIVDPPERTIRLGTCPAPADDGPCGAVLRVLPGEREVRCRWCGATWSESQWLALAAAQQALTEPEAAPDAGGVRPSRV